MKRTVRLAMMALTLTVSAIGLSQKPVDWRKIVSDGVANDQEIKVVEHAKPTTVDERVAIDFFLAEQYAKRKKYAMAVQRDNDILRVGPDSDRYRALLAKMGYLDLSGRHAEAFKCSIEGEKLGPKLSPDWEHVYPKGVATALSFPESAKAASDDLFNRWIPQRLKSLRSGDPAGMERLLLLCSSLDGVGETGVAQQVINRARDLHVSHPEVMYIELQHITDAHLDPVANCERLVHDYPTISGNSKTSTALRLKSEYVQGKYADVLDLYKIVLDLRDESRFDGVIKSGDIKLLAAYSAIKLGNYEKAVALRDELRSSGGDYVNLDSLVKEIEATGEHKRLTAEAAPFVRQRWIVFGLGSVVCFLLVVSLVRMNKR